jgi:acetyl esterase
MKPWTRLFNQAISGRQLVGRMALHGILNGITRLPFVLPDKRNRPQNVEKISNVPYLNTGERSHLLDIFRPLDTDGPTPTMLYVHGGAFSALSKDTHWMIARTFAKIGFTVFNINYRLAPRHRYPAALEDVIAAALWTHAHAAHYGADPEQLVLAGESAGANLVTALTVANSYRREEPFSQELWESPLSLSAVIAACGLLQTSDSERFHRKYPELNWWVADRIHDATKTYLGDVPIRPYSPSLFDPLLILEEGKPPERALPPFFACAGTRDPLISDSKRLKAALSNLETPCELKLYPGEIHAFHAMIWRQQAKQCWKDQFLFLNTHVGLKGDA